MPELTSPLSRNIPANLSVSKESDGTITVGDSLNRISLSISRMQALVLGAELIEASASAVAYAVQDAQDAHQIGRDHDAARFLDRLTRPLKASEGHY